MVDASVIRAAFASSDLEVADDALQSCVAICAEFSVSADELVAQWDAYSINHQLTGAASAETITGFRSELAQKKASSKAKDNAAVASQKKRFGGGKPATTPVIKREIKTEGQLNALYQMKSPEGKHARSFASPTGSNSKMARTNGMFSPRYVLCTIHGAGLKRVC